MGLPAGDKIGDEHAAIEGILHVGSGDAPVELAGIGHFHAGAIGFHFERPDAGVGSAAFVIADQEAAFLAFEETGAGMVGQAGGAGAKVGGGRQDVSGLLIVAHLPHPLVHPAARRAFLKADVAVEGMHRLMLHLPAGIAALDEIDDARLVALVGIIIHAESIAKFIEGDLFGVTQAGVEDLEARAIWLEAKGRALIRAAVFLTLLGDHRVATVTDCAVNTPVWAEGEAVEVMARKGNPHAEAFFHDLFFIRHSIVICVAQLIDLGNAGEIE